MANVNVVLHTDSCLSRTGDANQLGYWLGSTVTPWIEDAVNVAPQAATVAVLKDLVQPWRWTQVNWNLRRGAAAPTPAPAPAPHPAPIQPTALIQALETEFAAQYAAGQLAALGAPVNTGGPPGWAARLMQLSRTPAPLPLALGLAVVHPLAAEPGVTVRLSVEVADLTVGHHTLQFGVAYHVGPDTITLVAEDAIAGYGALSSPTRGELDTVKGLVCGMSRLVRSTGETKRNWVADLAPRLGRALNPWLRLADLVEADAELAPPTGGWTPALIHTAAANALEALFSNLKDQTGGSRLLAIMAGVDPQNPTRTEQQFLRAWATNLSAATPDGLDTLLAEWVEAAAIDGSPANGWPAKILSVYGDSERHVAFIRVLRTALPGTVAPVRDHAAAWLGSVRNREAFFNIMAPTEAAVDLYRSLARDAATTDDEDLARVKTSFGDKFVIALRAALESAGHPIPTADSVIKTLAGHLWVAVFEEAAALEPVAEAGLPIRADAIFQAAPSGAQRTWTDPHRLYDGFVLAARRTKSGLTKGNTTATDEDALLAAIDQAQDWADPVICTTADLSTLGEAAPWSDLVVPQPVSFDRGRELAPADGEVRNAIVTYRGGFTFPQSDLDSAGHATGTPSAPAPSPALELRFSPPTKGGAPKPDAPIAFGQVMQLRCAYSAPGGVAPQGWGASTSPWDLSRVASTFEAVDTGLQQGGAALRTTPKSFVVLRRTPAGPPRLLADPQERDGARLADRLTGPEDFDVRPLWRERMRGWSEFDRQRLDTAATCFLDAIGGVAPERVEFYVRAPALPLGDATPGSSSGDVWRYWTQRDVDAGDAAAMARLQKVDARSPQAKGGDVDRDDPAVVIPPLGTTKTGGVYIRLLALGKLGVSQTKSAALRLTYDQPYAKVVVKTVGSAAAPDLAVDQTAAPPVVTVTLPLGALNAISFQAFAPSDFFGEGADPRFSRLVAPGEMAGDPEWRRPARFENIDGVEGVGFAESLIAFECLPKAQHMPTPQQIWQAVRLAQPRGTVQATFAPDPTVTAFDYVTSVRAWRDPWIWHGGPIDEALVMNTFVKPLDEQSISKRDLRFVQFETEMYAESGPAGIESNADHEANAPSTLLFRLQRPDNVGADYLRVRVQAMSRYTALRRRLDPDGADLTISGNAEGSDLDSDAWKAIALSMRRTEPLPTPKPRIALPLFGSMGAAGGGAGGFAVMLDEPAYDVTTGAGLVERVVAEVVIERLSVKVDHAGTISDGETAALAVGMDATESTSGDPFGGQANGYGRVAWRAAGQVAWTGEGAWTPDAPAVRMRRAAVLGETLEPSSAAPLMPFASVIFDPALERGPELRPGTQAWIRLRSEPQISTHGDGLDGEAAASPWTASLLVTLLPDMAFAGLAAPIISRSGADLLITLKPDGASAAGKALFERWRQMPARPTSTSGPQGVVGAVVGMVVRDATNHHVLRPRCYTEGQLAGGGVQALTLRLKASDLAAARGTMFVQILEMRDFPNITQPVVAATSSLADRADHWLGGDEDPKKGQEDGRGRIIGMGARYFLELPD